MLLHFSGAFKFASRCRWASPLCGNNTVVCLILGTIIFCSLQRGKKAPEGLTSSEQISDFQQLASHPGLHSASIPGILALDLSADSARAVTGIVSVILCGLGLLMLYKIWA